MPARCAYADSVSTRTRRPSTVSGAANAAFPSLGIDVSQQLGDRFAVGVQFTTLIFAHNDLSARARWFVVAERRAGLYLGTNLHLWYSPLIINGLAPAGTLEAGYEWRADGGFTLGLGLGGGLIWIPPGGRGLGAQARWSGLPLVNLRIGESSP